MSFCYLNGSYKNNIDLTGFQKKIIYKYFINRRSNILYNNILSDEGGRFFHSQIRYMACKLKKNENINLPENYIWLSKNQIIKLIDKQKIDIEANLEMALSVALDSKIQYPAACNAIETLLVHKDIASAFLEKAIPLFDSNDVKLIGDKRSVGIGLKYEASLEDWGTEYLDLILSIKIVDDLEEAITHIQKYSSKHTDGIITENANTANKFMNVVNSAGVFHNCSTRFADGFRYGFGAEVGISTQTLPPRGPVGLEGLVTYKYFLKGDGNLVDDFSSGKAIYSHKDL